MLWIEIQYAKIIGTRLNLFKVVGINPFVANFRCPLCGDSKSHKHKTRGYMYQRSNHIFFYCHNCAASMSLSNFLKKMDADMYKEMRLEMFRNGAADMTDTSDDKFASGSPIKKLESYVNINSNNSILNYLDHASDHETAIKYLSERKIPCKFWEDIYFTDDFPAFVNSAFPDKKVAEPPCHRLIIPFRVPRGNEVVGVSARLIPNTGSVLNQRYYSISKPGYLKLWQPLDLDVSKLVYVTEGIFDAFLIENAVAMLGSDVSTAALRCLYNDFVYVFDNEPRNKQIVSRMNSKIKEGCKVVIWPIDNPYKDINEMILHGFRPSIEDHIKDGLAAEMALNTWKRM